MSEWYWNLEKSQGYYYTCPTAQNSPVRRELPQAFSSLSSSALSMSCSLWSKSVCKMSVSPQGSWLLLTVLGYPGCWELLDPISILSWYLVPVKDTAPPILKLRDSSPVEGSLCPSMASISLCYTSACFPLFWQNFRRSHSGLRLVRQWKSDMMYKRAVGDLFSLLYQSTHKERVCQSWKLSISVPMTMTSF